MRAKICIISTIGYPLQVFMGPHIKMLSKYYDVTLIANAVEEDIGALLGPNVRLITVKIERKISFFNDLRALISLYLIFKKENFLTVHSLMPKSGLLAMIASFFACVPCRIHTFTGQVWASKTGFKRWGLKWLDKVIVFCTTHLLVDSFSQRKFLIDEGVVLEEDVTVLGNGSVCGVDVFRFMPSKVLRYAVRDNLEIPQDAIVYLFLGRINKEKGVLDLAAAFSRMVENLNNIYLLIVGPDEEGLDSKLNDILIDCGNKYKRIDFTSQPEQFMAAADVICLPSYREGFGSVIIEAAACNVPAIASCIYGLTDAVENGKTGLLHPVGSVDAIEKCMLILFNDENFRNMLAIHSYERAVNYFSTEFVVDEMKNFYKQRIQ